LYPLGIQGFSLAGAEGIEFYLGDKLCIITVNRIQLCIAIAGYFVFM